MKHSTILCLVYIFLHLELNSTMEIWKESDFRDYGNADENNDLFKQFDDVSKKDLKDKYLKYMPHYHSVPSSQCSCDIEYRLLDLGNMYYPRYLHTGVCKPEACGGGVYRCIEKHYKVKVLKQRDPRSPENKLAVSLPENLKHSWQSEIVTVTVACECTL